MAIPTPLPGKPIRDIAGLNQFGSMRHIKDSSAFWAMNFIIVKSKRRLFLPLHINIDATCRHPWALGQKARCSGLITSCAELRVKKDLSSWRHCWATGSAMRKPTLDLAFLFYVPPPFLALQVVKDITSNQKHPNLYRTPSNPWATQRQGSTIFISWRLS